MQNKSNGGARRRAQETREANGEISTEVSSPTRATDDAEGISVNAPASAPKGRGQVILDYLRPAIVLTLVLTLIVGIAYPLVVTGIAQVIFNNQANGSLVTRNGQVIGSTLIGQNWTNPKYFHGRPSATLSPDGSQSQPYDAANSSASNNGPTSSNLQAEVQAELKVLKEDEACNGPNVQIPVDLVTSSGSGLDPDISVAGAMYQACRIAQERGMSLSSVQQLIQNHIHGRDLGVLGEPYVNVLELNMALDG
jgi:potassium-transporting ATPase KdpC subunit